MLGNYRPGVETHHPCVRKLIILVCEILSSWCAKTYHPVVDAHHSVVETHHPVVKTHHPIVKTHNPIVNLMFRDPKVTAEVDAVELQFRTDTAPFFDVWEILPDWLRGWRPGDDVLGGTPP